MSTLRSHDALPHRCRSDKQIDLVATIELSPEDLADEAILDDLARLQMETDIVADESLPEELDRQVRVTCAAVLRSCLLTLAAEEVPTVASQLHPPCVSSPRNRR